MYVLKSRREDRLYIGSTAEPDTRFAAHNRGAVKSTRRCRPWDMVLLEEHADRETAEKREKYLKSGWGRRWLKERLE